MAKFQPGQSGNPGGRSSVAQNNDKLRALSYADFLEMLNRCFEMKADALKDWIERTDATAFERAFGKLIHQTTEGNLPAMQLVLDRLYGKIKDIEITLDKIPDKVFVDEVNKRIAKLESA